MKTNTKKLLISLIILTVFSVQLFSPSPAKAAINLNWNNPNKGSNPYKFKLKDYLNPQMISSVIGCTGVGNKISGAITKFAQKFAQKKVDVLIDKLKDKSIQNICKALRDGISSALLSYPGITVGDVPLKSACEGLITQKSENKSLTKATDDVSKTLKASQTWTQCLSGIAITLAKNQLTAMTRATMNWINTGFNGDPMYVQNINSFMTNISDKLINKELDMFKKESGKYNIADYPNARIYSRTVVNADETTKNIADSLKQDLTSYLPNNPNPGQAIKNFSTNFAEGGWNGWLALTQHPQNNIVGFTIQAGQAAANEKQKKQAQQKAEVAQNNGFLSQKTCAIYALGAKGAGKKVAYNMTIAAAKKAYDEAEAILEKIKNKNSDAYLAALADEDDALNNLENAQADAKKAGVKVDSNAAQKCIKYKVVTPGSIIRDKVSAYINSPIRQTELAKTINDSLSALFSALLTKFRLNGLSSLGSNDTTAFNNVSGGFGSNSLTTGGVVDNEGNPTSGGGFTIDKNFDLTKDLGNTYYHVPRTELGKGWNAKTNTPMLSIGIGPYDPINKTYISDAYYTVKVAGDTKLFTNGYNVWNVGDRAYFDGTNWQNWKKGTPDPIKKRGILQIQQDYLVAAQELLKHLPGIMPEIGQLDYCIPGPNPNWLASSSKAINAFTAFTSAFGTKYTHRGFLVRDYVTINAPSGDVYNNFRNIFNGTNLWPEVIKSAPYQEIKYLASSAASPNKGGKWKGKSNRAEATDRVSSLKNKLMKAYNTFIGKYTIKMNSLYGVNSPMQKQFLENEATPTLVPNPAFLPVSSAALKVTSNILAYNDEITKTAKSYREAIAQTNLNIYKLKRIASQVSKIVQAAQARRDKKLADLKKANTNIPVQAGEKITQGDSLYSSGTNIDGKLIVMKYTPDLASIGISPKWTANEDIDNGKLGKVTKGSIKDWTIPVSCKKEEDLNYLNNNKIIVDLGGSKENRCNDGIDNDLDGLVDAQDPDCSGFYANKGPDNMSIPGVCAVDMTTYDENNPETIPPSDAIFCNERKSKSICLDSSSFYKKRVVDCSWTEINILSGTGNGNTGGGSGGFKPPNDYLSGNRVLPSEQN